MSVDQMRDRMAAARKAYQKKIYEQYGNPLTRTEKLCGKCGVVKPNSEYHKHSKMNDGLQKRCKKCCRENASIQPKYYGSGE